MQTEDTHLLRQSLVVGSDHPALCCSEILGSVETECRHITDCADHPVVALGPNGVSGIFDHEEMMFFSDVEDFIHLARLPGQVYGDNSFGSRRDFSLNLSWVDVKVILPDIGQDWGGTLVHDDISRSAKGQ